MKKWRWFPVRGKVTCTFTFYSKKKKLYIYEIGCNKKTQLIIQSHNLMLKRFEKRERIRLYSYKRNIIIFAVKVHIWTS
jgi:hypothetical protein